MLRPGMGMKKKGKYESGLSDGPSRFCREGYFYGSGKENKITANLLLPYLTKNQNEVKIFLIKLPFCVRIRHCFPMPQKETGSA